MRIVAGLAMGMACGPSPDVRIAPVHTLRDLVLEAPPDVAPDEVRWHSDRGDGIVGPRVPAERLWPGDTWTVDVGRFEAVDAITVPDPPGGNVLVILLDDVGVDSVSAWGRPDAPATPALDALAREGVRFDRAYASPVCSPTRGVLLTGRHARRTGLGWIVDTGSRDQVLPLEALLLPEALELGRGAEPWTHAAVGKWHLAGPRAENALDHPNASGFDDFSGLLGNPGYAEGRGYDRWLHLTNGVQAEREGYLTSATIDDALDRVVALPEPWFLYVATSAAHTPWTRPPEALLTGPLPQEPTDREAYVAVLQALDLELGRLLAEMPVDVRSRTTIVVMGDNGTPGHAVAEGYDPRRQKHHPYEGGVRVPLIVAGPHVRRPGRVESSLVHVADVFPTVAELAGVPLSGPDEALTVAAGDGPLALDGRSLLGVMGDQAGTGRQWVYTEGFTPNGLPPEDGRRSDRRALVEARFKLARWGQTERFFDLEAGSPTDPDGPDLLDDGSPLAADAEEAWQRLAEQLDALESELVYEGR